MSEVIVDESGIEEGTPDFKGFTRLERMLLFAVVTECERCIRSEGVDCMHHRTRIDCPFFSVREEYRVHDVELWRERVR